MTLVWAAVIVAFGMVWTAAVVMSTRHADRRLLARRRVLVSLKSGEGVSGVVTHSGPEMIVVSDAMIHDPAASSPSRAEGDIVVYRDNVAFTQRTTDGR